MGNYLEQFLFGIFPYLAMAVFLIETSRRYRKEKITYTTYSSQFLENKDHFWAMMAWHYGIIGTLAGHAIAFLFPKQLLLWNSIPIRLYIIEATAFIFGSLALIGVVAMIMRRIKNSKVAAHFQSTFGIEIEGGGIGLFPPRQLLSIQLLGKHSK